MRVGILALALLAAAVPAAGAQETVLHLDFDPPHLPVEEEGTGRLVEGREGSKALLVEKTEPEGMTARRVELPAERLAGRLITLSARLRAEGVSPPPKPWLGVKVMLVLRVGDGTEHPQVDLAHGTYGWVEASRAIRMRSDLRAAELVLGLQQVTGRVWFDDVRVGIGRRAEGRRRERRFTGHQVPRLRGVMYGTETSEKDIRDLAEWGANHIRLQINWTPMKQAEEWAADLDRYDEWLERALPEIDRGIDLCEKYGLLVNLDLHTPPGGRSEGGVCRMFTDEAARDKLVEVWQRLARRYRGRKAVWAYDLMNEPVEPPAGADGVSWADLFVRTTRAIRRIDPGKPVIYEPGPWGGPDGFDQVGPLPIDRVIYSLHMYRPHRFTHQGVRDNPAGVRYPGRVGGQRWDRERLREAIRPAIDFQQTFNVHIYVGEFSAARWAPDGSAHRYLRDCISLFEEYGWDWAYHAYREWHGWSVEHGPDPADTRPVEKDTSRKRLLLKYFGQNRRPAFYRAERAD